MDLTLPVTRLPGIGKFLSGKLQKLGIKSVFGLLYHLPARYEDRRLMSPVSQCQPGETVTLMVTLKSLKNEYTRGGKIIQKAMVADSTGTLPVIWFNQPFIVKSLPQGATIALSGKITASKSSRILISPDYELIPPNSHKTELIHTGRLVPIYPETAGITSKWLRTKIYALLSSLPPTAPYPETLLPPEIAKLSWEKALKSVHFPKSPEEAHEARHRLAFDELLLLQLTSLIRRQQWQSSRQSHILKAYPLEISRFTSSLPFTLTPSQSAAIKEILQDLASPKPMNRLLQGDVGSGKTVVASLAAYLNFLNGLSTVFLAPTTILAQQHYSTLSQLLSSQGVKIKLVMGGRKPKDLTGAQIIVGTHALLSASLKFSSVGLVVIDEQHRFGVLQRSLAATLGSSETVPHVLTMTATPIPRTVALTLHADLDLSLITDLPQNREPVKTWVVPEIKRQSSYNWISDHLKQNTSQAFWVCPFIEPSESVVTVRAATQEYERLKNIFSNFRLGLLHGRMKAAEKERVISAFRAGDYHILVCTPVVEVGIDIPNATLMIIEGAERFGLAQLHQLRGRVGRGSKKSYCLLFSRRFTKRLKAMEKHLSGADLAEIDFKLRGPGEIYGTSQHGVPRFKIATYEDANLISQAKLVSKQIFSQLDDYQQLRSLLGEGKIDLVQPN